MDLAAQADNRKSLTQALGELDERTLVYLGSASSFFDVATAGEMRQTKYLKKLSDDLHDSFKQAIESAKKNFLTALTHPPVWKEPDDEKDKDKSIEDYIALMYKQGDKLRRRQQAIPTAQEREKNFIPLCKRKVNKIYNRIDKTGVCIVIEGDEIGSYWFAEDKKSGKNRLEREEKTE